MNRISGRILLLVAAFALFLVPVAAIAAGGFDDVDDDSVFIADIQWMKDNGVTAGCNPPTNTNYCPKNNVTREQMSAFMHRLAVNQIVDAATALEADHATAADSATNAGKVDGKDAVELESLGFMARDAGWVEVPAGGTTTVAGLSLPEGSYVIFARGSINSNMPAAGRHITCKLSAGTTSQTIDNLFLNANFQPGETEEASLMIAHTFDSAGTARLSCEADASWSGNVIAPTVTAISVQGLTIDMLTAATGGDVNG